MNLGNTIEGGRGMVVTQKNLEGTGGNIANVHRRESGGSLRILQGGNDLRICLNIGVIHQEDDLTCGGSRLRNRGDNSMIRVESHGGCNAGFLGDGLDVIRGPDEVHDTDDHNREHNQQGKGRVEATHIGWAGLPGRL